MKLFLDDCRPVPPGWVLAKTAHECIAILQKHKVEELSLDHDLGDATNGTGYDVVLWLEELAMYNPLAHIPPIIKIHSANPVGIRNMQEGIKSIRRIQSSASPI